MDVRRFLHAAAIACAGAQAADPAGVTAIWDDSVWPATAPLVEGAHLPALSIRLTSPLSYPAALVWRRSPAPGSPIRPMASATCAPVVIAAGEAAATVWIEAPDDGRLTPERMVVLTPVLLLEDGEVGGQDVRVSVRDPQMPVLRASLSPEVLPEGGRGILTVTAEPPPNRDLGILIRAMADGVRMSDGPGVLLPPAAIDGEISVLGAAWDAERSGWSIILPAGIGSATAVVVVSAKPGMNDVWWTRWLECSADPTTPGDIIYQRNGRRSDLANAAAAACGIDEADPVAFTTTIHPPGPWRAGDRVVITTTGNCRRTIAGPTALPGSTVEIVAAGGGSTGSSAGGYGNGYSLAPGVVDTRSLVLSSRGTYRYTFTAPGVGGATRDIVVAGDGIDLGDGADAVSDDGGSGSACGLGASAGIMLAALAFARVARRPVRY